MNNRIVSRSLMGALCSACFTTVSAQERPNIIVFLVDDMGLMDTSVPFVTDENGNAQRQPLNDWYSQYGAPGKPGNPLFHFLCTKREFPFQSIHHDRTKCGPSPHYELDQCGKQQPHSIRTIRLELERAYSSGYDLSLFITTSRIQNDPCG